MKKTSMLIDLDKYRLQKQEIVKIHQRSYAKDAVLNVAFTSPGIHTPNVVLAFYLSEEIGFTSELVESIKGLIKFYKYTHIKGAPDNMPDFDLIKV